MTAPRVVVAGSVPGATQAQLRARIEAYGAVLTSSVDADTRVVLLGRRVGKGCAVQRTFDAACKFKSRGANLVIVHHLEAMWAALAPLRPAAPPTPLLPRGPRAGTAAFHVAF